MTSSIYPQPVSIGFVGLVNSITVTNGGAGFDPPLVVTIDPPIGIQATADATINGAGTVSSVTVTNEGAGYLTVPTVTIDAPASGTTATAIANLSNSKIISITITNVGSGYTSVPNVTIPIETGGTTATATATEIGGVVQDTVIITEKGSGYISAPNIVVIGATTGGGAVLIPTITSLESSTNILNSDIAITNTLVSPGRGGTLRLLFGFAFTTSPGTIGVFNNGSLKGNFNADTNSEIIGDGYYRFDIDVEAGDNINLQLLSGTGGGALTTNFIRAHLVQFGA